MRKTSRHGLRRGAPRVLASHGGAAGRAYSLHYRALTLEYGVPDRTSLLRALMGVAAAAYVGWIQATADLAAAREKRQVGRGRRPSASMLERYARRVGLEHGSYMQALEQVRSQAAAQRPKKMTTEEAMRILSAPADEHEDQHGD